MSFMHQHIYKKSDVFYVTLYDCLLYETSVVNLLSNVNFCVKVIKKFTTIWQSFWCFVSLLAKLSLSLPKNGHTGLLVLVKVLILRRIRRQRFPIKMADMLWWSAFVLLRNGFISTFGAKSASVSKHRPTEVSTIWHFTAFFTAHAQKRPLVTFRSKIIYFRPIWLNDLQVRHLFTCCASRVDNFHKVWSRRAHNTKPIFYKNVMWLQNQCTCPFFPSSYCYIVIVYQLQQYCQIVYRVLNSQLKMLIFILLCLANISLCFMCFYSLIILAIFICVLSVCLFVFYSFV